MRNIGNNFLFKTRRIIAILLAVCLCPTFAWALPAPPTQAQAADAPPEEQAANDGVYLFSEACLSHLPKLNAVKDWAAAKGLHAIKPSFANRVYLGDGDDGIGWFVHGKTVNAVLSIRSRTGGCGVYLDHADPDAFAKWYDIILNSLAIPQGEKVIKTPEPDKVTTGDFGKRTGKVRLIYKNGYALMLVMITDEKFGGAYQDTMQITVVPHQ